MLNIFPRMDLPEPPKGPFTPTDVASFHELYEAASSVQLNCVALLHQAGYREEGKRGELSCPSDRLRRIRLILTRLVIGLTSSIGVLLLAKNSYEDQIIYGGITPSGTPKAPAVRLNNTRPVAPVYSKGNEN